MLLFESLLVYMCILNILIKIYVDHDWGCTKGQYQVAI